MEHPNPPGRLHESTDYAGTPKVQCGYRGHSVIKVSGEEACHDLYHCGVVDNS